MRLVFISQQFPWPLDSGGNIRTYHSLVSLLEHFEITLVSSTPDGQLPADFPEHKNLTIELFPIRKNASTMFTSILSSLLRSVPAVISYNRMAGVKERITAIAQEDLHVVFFCNHLDTWQYVAEIGDRAWIDTHNLMADYYRTEKASGSISKRMFYSWQMNSIMEYERSAFDGARGVFFCSDSEREQAQSLSPAGRYTVVPNGVDLAAFPFEGGTESQVSARVFTLFFSGHLGYPPNADGILFFLRSVYPDLLLAGEREGWEIRVIVAGKSPPDELQDVARSNPGVQVTGFVPSMRPYIRQSDLAIVPLLSGGGTRLKVIEAWSCGLPIVSTSLGAHGIDYEDNADIVIAEEPQAMIQAILRLIGSAETRSSMAIAGRKKAESAYSWTNIMARLSERLVADMDDQ